MVVFTVFGVNYVVARFAKIVISCDCILDFDRGRLLISLVNGHSLQTFAHQRINWRQVSKL